MSSNLNRALEWTPPEVQPIILAALSLITLAFFYAAAWPKLKILLNAKGVGKTNRIFERAGVTLKIAFAQTKLLQEKGAGWMHALIFWGFLILLFRAAEFFLIGFFPTSAFPIHNSVYSAYMGIKDIAVILVTSAVSFALYRRVVIKPNRLTLSGEGLLILVLILAIMISDTLFDSSYSALRENPSGPLSSIFGPALQIFSNNVLGHLHSLAYWAHVSSILIFLVLLPRSKHFHILTSIPNVFFSKLDFGNNIGRIDFEEEESFGITNSKDLNWKQMLDLHTCTQCGRCDRACPAWATDKPLSPQQLTVDLRDHLNGPQSSDILGSVIEDEVIWSCTTCGACEAACPVMIEYVDKIIGLRRGLVLAEDRYPKEFTEAFKSLEAQSNPWGFPKTSRSDWAKGLGVPIWDKARPTEYLYFAGCNGSFDARGKKITQAVAQTLKEAGVDFSILGNDEGCTGDPARRSGNEYLFDMLASENAQTFKDKGVRKVVTHCPHCLNSLKNEYAQFGAQLEVIHHSELLQKLIKEGKIPSKQNQEEKIVFHDSCYLGRHNGIYEAPREVINQTAGPAEEIEQSRETGTCCGAGGARFLLEENTGTRMSHHRLNELMANEPDTIAVSCPFCVLMLEDAVKAKNLNVQVKDIGEIAAKKN